MLKQTNLARADLNLLVLFDVVLKERHVGRAAEKLHLSSSAISHGLTRLRRLLNDPLFLKTPKGVVPTARASELAEPVADILARASNVIYSSAPFDAATSKRRFTVGAPDGVSVVFLPPLLSKLRQSAPGVDIATRQVLPAQGETSPDRAWRSAFTELEDGVMDVAILPSDLVPTRFHKQALFEQDFVIAARRGHPFARQPTLDRYCEAQHLVVSLTGDPRGFVDIALEARGRRRRVALTAPNFMLALALVAETDLIAALPRPMASMHAKRFDAVVVEAPLELGRFQLNAVASKAAMLDAGVSWLMEVISSLHPAPTPRRRRKAGG